MGAFFYPTGIDNGYSGVAAFVATLFGGVTGYSGMTAPAQPTGNDGFLQAMADAILGAAAAGPTGIVFDKAGSGQTTQATFTGMAGGTFLARCARFYMLEADVNAIFASSSGANAIFRFSIDGSGLPALNTHQCFMSAPNTRSNVSFRQRVFMAAGVRTVVLEWRSSATVTYDATSGATVHAT